MATKPAAAHAKKRTLVRRILSSYAILLFAFAITFSLSFRDMRASAEEASSLRSAYVPLSLSIGEALAAQNVLSAQLNHITSAKNPTDVREWIETATRARPITFEAIDHALEGLAGEDPDARELKAEIKRELGQVEELLAPDAEDFGRLFRLLSEGNRRDADRAHGELIKRHADAAARLRALKGKVEGKMENLAALGQARERRSLTMLTLLSLLTLLVGVGISLYARRLLQPVERITARAKAVASGDLVPEPAPDDSSEIGELASTFENMVEALRDARTELVHAERLATIGKMAAHITHEIRNPLSSIGLNLELLEGEIAETPGASAKESLALLASIRSETQRLSRIAEQYLSVARRPSPTLEAESIEDLLAEFAAFVRPEMEQKKITLRLEVEADLPEVSIDESQIRQAILNLVRNAREAIGEGGTITLSVGRAVGGGIDVLVDDDGPGIPEDVRASIFDPFFTTKARGTGLGLAVTREIIEAHGGLIVCEARSPRGTRFRIHLP